MRGFWYACCIDRHIFNHRNPLGGAPLLKEGSHRWRSPEHFSSALTEAIRLLQDLQALRPRGEVATLPPAAEPPPKQCSPPPGTLKQGPSPFRPMAFSTACLRACLRGSRSRLFSNANLEACEDRRLNAYISTSRQHQGHTAAWIGSSDPKPLRRSRPKGARGLDRFRLQGLEKVNRAWALMTTTHNLL